jgi:hypothetical protein
MVQMMSQRNMDNYKGIINLATPIVTGGLAVVVVIGS